MALHPLHRWQTCFRKRFRRIRRGLVTFRPRLFTCCGHLGHPFCVCTCLCTTMRCRFTRVSTAIGHVYKPPARVEIQWRCFPKHVTPCRLLRYSRCHCYSMKINPQFFSFARCGSASNWSVWSVHRCALLLIRLDEGVARCLVNATLVAALRPRNLLVNFGCP